MQTSRLGTLLAVNSTGGAQTCPRPPTGSGEAEAANATVQATSRPPERPSLVSRLARSTAGLVTTVAVGLLAMACQSLIERSGPGDARWWLAVLTLTGLAVGVVRILRDDVDDGHESGE